MKGKLIEDSEVKKKYSLENPYQEWLDERLTPLKNIEIKNKLSEYWLFRWLIFVF